MKRFQLNRTKMPANTNFSHELSNFKKPVFHEKVRLNAKSRSQNQKKTGYDLRKGLLSQLSLRDYFIGILYIVAVTLQLFYCLSNPR